MSSGYPTHPSAPPAPPSWDQQRQQHGYGASASPYGRPPSAYGSDARPPSPYGPAMPSAAPSSQKPPSNSSFPQPYYAHSPSGQWNQPAPSVFSSSPSFQGGYPPYAYPQPYASRAYFPPGTDPEIIRAFQTADRDGSGIIDAMELQSILSINHPFSMRTVRLLIHLFSTSGAEKIGSTDFVVLWKALKEWRGIFERFDRDKSGSIDIREMREALLSLGYAISPTILQCLLQKFDRTGQAKAMDYDSFIECGLIVKGLTEKFKSKDTRLTGSATLSYEEFMLIVLPFILA